MKKFNLFMFAILVIAGALSLVSFVSKPAKPKPFTTKTFYYGAGVVNQRIQPGYTVTGVEHSITHASFTNPDNWFELDQEAIPYTNNDGVTYLKSISFQWESVSDGGGDWEISLEEALEGIWSNYEYQALNDFGYFMQIDANGGIVTISIEKAGYANQ
jgi:hypothetical protein